jgi:hypothetical protein
MRAALAFALVAIASRVAYADDVPLADQKFDEAQKLREAGKLDESCKLFRESLRLNPNAIGTLLNVARCAEEQGKLASAVRTFKDARERADEQHLAPQRDAADQHLKTLVDRVPHLALAFAAGLPPGAQITVDDLAVDPKNAADVLVDPGTVHVVVSAPGYVAFEARLDIAERDHKAQIIPKLAPPAVIKNPRRLVGKIVTFVGGGAAVAALGLAIGAKIDNVDQLHKCTLRDGVEFCDPNVSNRANNDHTLGNTATGIGISGLVAAAVGASLWYFSPNRERPPYVTVVPAIAPGQAGLVAAWRF